ncbi:3-octaprenyl-4-hydroxybenzoate carboxy-lyase [Euryarchaeota archaeon ex4484_178]|nr:MAG: 3-octaprenyl-4-hydroxybenzoate carboxy-lyase [Euryarchaeota archaeon ex4484_178]
MLEKYLEEFQEEVVRVKTATRKDMVNKMKEERIKILHFEDVNGYEVMANIWSLRERFKKVFGQELIPLLLKSIENPMNYDTVDFDMDTHDFSLLDFPFPKFYEKDGGRYITSAVVFAEYEGKRNVSFHRMMILDDRRAAIRLVPRDLYRMHLMAKERGEELKVGVVIGMEPNVLLAAATSVDYSMDEMRIDITGTYDIVRKQPVVVFERFYYRKRPIFHILLPGGYEHYNLMGLPREPTIYREIKRAGVEVIDVHLTPGGCSWLHAVVKIRKNREDDGKRAIEAAFKGHKSLKHVVVVDEDIDIKNMEEIEWAIATRFQGDRDMILYENVRGSSLDPSSHGEEHLTTKVGVDATAPLGRLHKFRRVD